MYPNFFKPLLDIVTAIIVLLLVSPILIFSIIGLSIVNFGTPFFVQKRPGKNGRIFNIIKLKTMTDERDADGNLLSDADRLTVIGRIIRKMSLDEIPQLFNVIKGEMSIVGPRPLLPSYLELYSKEQARRHHVKPGITGWAQVNGRNLISWERKFELDVWYVDNQTFLLDIKILMLTVKKVFLREGINSSGQATTESFKG
ncbi:sugar transferase [Dokdonia pacifica]|uniref:Sugar transferase involved in LPS biosynthesis (Colanic, teichoic acid) n=1 Tax=Dokdonia pacifica TaxID=1627892 RepID=A0A238YN84_9FLAO|nr:sugar transferase [Dokdonia pacifica]GGG11461.1 sugar transferase [Dokdonia pacifica]SNR71889.1 Sugar transferase involved in LPS biosynthesis (colanic, teichoic acid) [Dokdonia pacifica]